MTVSLDLDTLLALAGYAFAATWTPGPNNMMLASSGATFGWQATLPHAMGVALGFPLMFFLISLGLGQAFETLPAFRMGLAWLGCAVMLWLAWRIASAAPTTTRRAEGRTPLSFIGAAAFQWVNPKAWVMCLSVSAAFVTGQAPMAEAAIGATVFVAAGLSSSQGWTLFGTGIARVMGDGIGIRVFNIAMGTLLGLSALWLVFDPIA
ncbi:MAG: LysE family translocator [Pseudomonadota bacterium]